MGLYVDPNLKIHAVAGLRKLAEDKPLNDIEKVAVLLAATRSVGEKPEDILRLCQGDFVGRAQILFNKVAMKLEQVELYTEEVKNIRNCFTRLISGLSQDIYNPLNKVEPRFPKKREVYVASLTEFAKIVGLEFPKLDFEEKLNVLDLERSECIRKIRDLTDSRFVFKRRAKQELLSAEFRSIESKIEDVKKSAADKLRQAFRGTNQGFDTYTYDMEDLIKANLGELQDWHEKYKN